MNAVRSVNQNGILRTKASVLHESYQKQYASFLKRIPFILRDEVRLGFFYDIIPRSKSRKFEFFISFDTDPLGK